MKKTLLEDTDLLQAVDEMERGLVDADLGGNTLEEKIYKKRVALPGRGKSGSTRTIVATSKAGKWFFLFGFEKNERDTIAASELENLRKVAEGWLAASDDTLAKAVAAKELEEVTYENR